MLFHVKTHIKVIINHGSLLPALFFPCIMLWISFDNLKRTPRGGQGLLLHGEITMLQGFRMLKVS